MRLKWVIGVVVGVVVLVAAAPLVARWRFVSSVRHNCGGCTFQIERLTFKLAPFRVAAEGVDYHGNPANFVEVSFEIPRLEGDVAAWPLIRGTWKIDDVVATAPAFLVVEKDPKPETPPSPNTFPLNLPPLSMASVWVHDGTFTYIHRERGRDASIHITRVEGAGKNFSSRPGLGSSNTTFDVASHLERSGTSRIRASFDLLASDNDDHLDIELRDQSLADMDPYFENESGVRVRGLIEHAKATMNIRRGILSGELVAGYRNLKLLYDRTPDRSAAGVFFSEALQKIVMDGTREGPTPAGASFRVTRPAGESLIKFLLSGLRPAAKKIMSHAR